MTGESFLSMVSSIDKDVQEQFLSFSNTCWSAHLGKGFFPRAWSWDLKKGDEVFEKLTGMRLEPDEKDPRWQQAAAQREMLWRMVGDFVIEARTVECTGLLETVAKRNQHAQSLGYANYFDFRLALDGLEGFEELWSRWEVANRIKSSKIPETIHSSNYQKRIETLREETFRSHCATLMAEASCLDFSERRGANTYLLDPPKDIRVVIGKGSMATRLGFLWHELGHMWYGRGQSDELPWSLRRPPLPWIDEAVAEITFCLCTKIFTPLLLDNITQDTMNLLHIKRRKQMRIQLLLSAFERFIYEEPGPLCEDDFQGKWESLCLEILGTIPFAWESVEDSLMARPGDQSVYVMAQHFCNSYFPKLPQELRPCRAFLTENLFRFGASLPWPQLLREFDTKVHSTNLQI